ncbi:MAG: NusA-like transcription termination signal-binding factor [Thermoprotei archaeon]|nr:MAG: transcription elongation factor NusA [Desulfurococcales archaeon ex4484_217_2]RLG73541.1 MAG: NusA-like transcription termination signal-binding factor [Thermoprotei archaeon]
MPEIKLTAEEMRYIALFQDLTRATVRDCIIDESENRIIFLVKPGDMGLAIGRNGINIKRLRKLLGRNIEVVEYADTVEKLAKNALAPARVLNVKVLQTPTGKKKVIVTVDPQDKGIAIGKAGRNVARARMILKRYFDIDSVIVT